jgi:hypothetical protein
MAEYKVDRELLNSYSTEEILRILKDEKDDYTPEALKVFAQILESRGAGAHTPTVTDRPALPAPAVSTRPRHDLGSVVVNSPSDAVRVLNTLLSGVIDGTIEPQVGQVASNIVMNVLHAKEQEFMTESEEES